MDMMELRRMVMAQMASGADYISGTFTVPNDINDYTLNFGKTFNKYLFFIDMTDDSKSDLLATGINNIKVFSTLGVYPHPQVNNVSPAADENTRFNYRVNPSTGAVTCSVNGSPANSMNTTSITFLTGLYTSGAYYLYRGSTYKYFIVEIK